MSETDDPIVLRAPAAFATVGDPTDPDGERVIELPAGEEGADTKTFELPADDVDVARALLKRYHRITVAKNPTDADLDVKSRVDRQHEWAQQQVDKNAKRRRKKTHFDPANDRPANHQKIRVKEAWDALHKSGNTKEANRLRRLAPLSSQTSYITELREEGMLG